MDYETFLIKNNELEQKKQSAIEEAMQKKAIIEQEMNDLVVSIDEAKKGAFAEYTKYRQEQDEIEIKKEEEKLKKEKELREKELKERGDNVIQAQPKTNAKTKKII